MSRVHSLFLVANTHFWVSCQQARPQPTNRSCFASTAHAVHLARCCLPSCHCAGAREGGGGHVQFVTVLWGACRARTPWSAAASIVSHAYGGSGTATAPLCWPLSKPARAQRCQPASPPPAHPRPPLFTRPSPAAQVPCCCPSQRQIALASCTLQAPPPSWCSARRGSFRSARRWYMRIFTDNFANILVPYPQAPPPSLCSARRGSCRSARRWCTW